MIALYWPLISIIALGAFGLGGTRTHPTHKLSHRDGQRFRGRRIDHHDGASAPNGSGNNG